MRRDRFMPDSIGLVMTLGVLTVLGQVVLLTLIFGVAFPRSFELPKGIVYAAIVPKVFGWVLIVRGMLSLRRSLTPMPVPRDQGTLRTTGVYRFSRHPIYGGLLLLAIVQFGESGSWYTFGLVALLAIGLFMKARWEEFMLKQRYPEYVSYKRRTRMFF